MKSKTRLGLIDDEIRMVVINKINNILLNFETLSKKDIKYELRTLKSYVTD